MFTRVGCLLLAHAGSLRLLSRMSLHIHVSNNSRPIVYALTMLSFGVSSSVRADIGCAQLYDAFELLYYSYGDNSTVDRCAGYHTTCHLFSHLQCYLCIIIYNVQAIWQGVSGEWTGVLNP